MKGIREFLRRGGLVCLASGVVVGLWTTTSHAISNCAQLCGGSNPCSFNSLKIVDAGSVIDCTGTDITIGAFGNLQTIDGGFKLIANNLMVSGNSSQSGTITAIEGAAGIPGSLDIELAGALYLAGKFRANGTHGGGRIIVHAGGNITIPEVGNDGIEALGTSPTADGGEIYVETKGALVVNDPVLADSGGGADVAGGSIEIRAAQDITTDLDGHISAYGHTGGGGEITVFSSGSVVLREHLKAEGLGSGSDGGGVFVHAEQGIDVSADISVMGGVNVTGVNAVGGTVELAAGCGGVAVNALIRANGGQVDAGDNGGSIEIRSAGPVLVNAGATLDVHALSPVGDGGFIDLNGDGAITIANTATLDARGGTSSPGTGGAISLSPCSLNVASGAVLDARAFAGGSINIGATKLPPTTGTQPLLVSSGAQVRAAGGSGGTPGTIRVAPLQMKYGVCTTGPACQFDSDCVVGCENGICTGPRNPDTAGVSTQFDVSAVRGEDSSLPSCSQACSQ